MKPVFYGPFARLADWYHGWRDGRKGIPPVPSDRGRPELPVSTAQREYLIRRAQDAFDHEYTRLEASRHASIQRLARARESVAGAQDILRRIEKELPEAQVPLTEAELTRRRPGEERYDERFIRLRRTREHARRAERVRERIRSAETDVSAAREVYAAAEEEASQLYRVAQARARRIHEHTHRRLAAYRRRLVRSHAEGGWVNEWLSTADPAMPAWARAPEPGIRPIDPTIVLPPPPPPPPPPEPRMIETVLLGRRTVFGSLTPPADYVVHGYGVLPAHFTIVRESGGFRVYAHSDRWGPYVNAQQIRMARLKPGQFFDLTEYRFRFTDDGEGVQVFLLGPCDLVVAGVYSERGKKESRSRLTNISLVHRERNVLAILGPSGAGKTSLFRALLGELELDPKRGQMFFRKLDLRTRGEQVREMLGYVPQENDLYRTLTVGRLLTYADRLRRPKGGDRDAWIRQVCRGLDVDKQLDQLISTLSGGQLKRVSIALEVLSQPALLMLDEPTSGLDAGMDREVMQILRDYAEERGQDPKRDPRHTVIVITHSTEHLYLAHQVLVVAPGGRAVYLGPPGGVLQALGVKTYAQLMKVLSDETDKGRARIAALVRHYEDSDVAAEAAREAVATAADVGRRELPAATRRGARYRFWHQLRVLLGRQVALVAARGTTKNTDQRGLLDGPRSFLVVILPFVITAGAAALAALVSGKEGLGLGSPEPDAGTLVNAAAPAALSLLTTLCILVGQALTYSDIVAEYAIIRREYRTGTLSGAVMVSKWLVFTVAAVLQATIVTVVYTAIRPAPANAIMFEPTVELLVNLAFTTVAAMSLGLLISVVARKLEQAVAMATGAAIAQVALNGVASSLSDKWYLNYLLSFVLPARWGLSATASSVDLRGTSRTHADALWAHTAGQWALDLGWLVGISALCFVGAHMILVRRLKKPTGPTT